MHSLCFFYNHLFVTLIRLSVNKQVEILKLGVKVTSNLKRPVMLFAKLYKNITKGSNKSKTVQMSKNLLFFCFIYFSGQNGTFRTLVEKKNSFKENQKCIFWDLLCDNLRGICKLFILLFPMIFECNTIIWIRSRGGFRISARGGEGFFRNNTFSGIRINT